MTLEIPTELETRLRPLADERGETLEAFALTQLEKLTRATGNNAGAPELSPMARALAMIEANPIRSLGPLDATADLEELRATRAAELAG